MPWTRNWSFPSDVGKSKMFEEVSFVMPPLLSEEVLDYQAKLQEMMFKSMGISPIRLAVEGKQI